MKEIINKVSSFFEGDCLKSCKDKITKFATEHPEWLCLSLLAIACLAFLFMGIGCYPLIDVDETRYAIMARDLAGSMNWNNLMLNFEPFLEKPPLYFWIVARSVQLFNEFNSFTVRFPIALLSSFLVFFTYFFGKKVISRKFGVISALILLSSMFYLVLSHIAILDIVLTVFLTSALYCGVLTHFVEERHKKYYWWYFYLFAGLAFLAKGILGIIIPAIIIFAYNFFTKTLKEIFKPVNILPGLVIFLALILPWHIIMYFEYGNRFIKEYFLLHHFARFIDSANIGRQRPFLYFVPVFLLGFLPWALSFMAFLIDGFKKLTAKFKQSQGAFVEKLMAIFKAETNEEKLMLFASLYFFLTFLIFSTSSTKLPTYILPVFPAAALMTGYFWYMGDEKAKYEKEISITTQTLAAILILSCTAFIGIFFMLPLELQVKILPFKSAAIIGLILTGMLLLKSLETKKVLSIIFAHILTMLLVTTLAVSNIFNLVYQGGENEIVNFSTYATEGDSQLVTFDFAVKPSAMLKYEKKVIFITEPDFKMLEDALNFKYGPTFIIVKNKNLEEHPFPSKIQSELELLETGEKYSLYYKDPQKKLDKDKLNFIYTEKYIPQEDFSLPQKP